MRTLCNLFDCEHGLRSLIDFVSVNPQYCDTFERFQNFIIAVNADERSRDFSRFRANLDEVIKSKEKTDNEKK